MWISEINGSKYWQERLTDPLTGKSRIVSCKIQKDTPSGRKAAREKLETRLLSKKPQPKSKMKLSQLVKKYEDAMTNDVKNGDLRESTRMRNTTTCNTMLKILGDVYLDKMTAGYVKQKLVESGRDNTGKNELLKRFKTMLNWAYSLDLLPDRAVIDKLGHYAEPSEREKIKDKYLEKDQVEADQGRMQGPRAGLPFLQSF